MAAERTPADPATPMVSVIIPAYNQGQFVAAAVESVLRQSCQQFEIIVVDDGSTDNTASVVAAIGDPRVRYVYQPNRGLSAARNTGIRNSTGEFLSFLDSDDLFLPGKLEWLIAALRDAPDAGIAAGKALPIDEEGNRVGRPFETPIPEDGPRLLLGNPLHVGSVVVRRSWQERVGFFDETLRSYEDWDMWLRLRYAGCRSVWVPKPVSLYRFHRAQMTRIGTQMTRSTFAVLDKFFSQEDVLPDWCVLKSMAYSRAHLRAAAQSFLAEDHDSAGAHLISAVKEDRSLLDNESRLLADHFRSWTDLPKITDPLRFLDQIYRHLPDELSSVANLRRRRLAAAAAEHAFRSYTERDFNAARASALKAMLNDLSHFTNVGLISVFLQSLWCGWKSR